MRSFQNLDLFAGTAYQPHYNGPEYDAERDHARLKSQTERIFELMSDGQWRTLPEIARITRDPPASISAQLRHLRKPRFGAHTIERRSRKGALFEYRLIVNSGLS